MLLNTWGPLHTIFRHLQPHLVKNVIGRWHITHKTKVNDDTFAGARSGMALNWQAKVPRLQTSQQAESVFDFSLVNCSASSTLDSEGQGSELLVWTATKSASLHFDVTVHASTCVDVLQGVQHAMCQMAEVVSVFHSSAVLHPNPASMHEVRRGSVSTDNAKAQVCQSLMHAMQKQKSGKA